MQNESNVAESQVRHEVTVGTLEVSRVYTGNYQKEGTLTAELKQVVTTKSHYPKKSVTTNMQDNPFATEDFGFEEQEFTNNETRVAWIDVPANATVESVKAKLAEFPKANLYKVLANKPILSDAQQYGISANLTTKDIIGNSQAIRYPEDHSDAALRGKLILDPKGKVQYRAVFFLTKGGVDVDHRSADPSDFYATPEIAAELGMTTEQIAAMSNNEQKVL